MNQGGAKAPLTARRKPRSPPLFSGRGDNTTRFELLGPDATFVVEAQRVEGGFKIAIGGETFLLKLERTDVPDVLVAQFGDKPVNVLLEAADDRTVSIIIEGERFVFRRPTPSLNPLAPGPPPQKAPEAPGTLASPLPGRITSISIRAGQSVKSGDVVLVVESMKMETAIRSDRDGFVDEVLVAEGSTVRRGQPLLRYRV